MQSHNIKAQRVVCDIYPTLFESQHNVTTTKIVGVETVVPMDYLVKPISLHL